jgi:hypothetical protein
VGHRHVLSLFFSFLRAIHAAWHSQVSACW